MKEAMEDEIELRRKREARREERGRRKGSLTEKVSQPLEDSRRRGKGKE